jgi:hypothetical protein
MGVRIVNITKPDVVVGVARVVKEEQAPDGQGGTNGGADASASESVSEETQEEAPEES